MNKKLLINIILFFTIGIIPVIIARVYCVINGISTTVFFSNPRNAFIITIVPILIEINIARLLPEKINALKYVLFGHAVLFELFLILYAIIYIIKFGW